MDIVNSILFGLLVGVLVKWVMPGKEPDGFIVAIPTRMLGEVF